MLVLLLSLITASSAQELPRRSADSVAVALGAVTRSLAPNLSACQTSVPLAPCVPEFDEGFTADDYQGGHGQIFFGSGPFYISHLPLSSPPHNFQAIYEVDFPDTDAGRASKALYLARPDQGFASFSPGESWGYPDFNCSIDQGPRTLASGRLHQGQYERGGPFIGRTGLIVKRRIYFRRWDVNSFPRSRAEGNPQANGEYVVFGEGNQFFTARVISQLPDADHIQPVPADLFRSDVGGANHSCYSVTQAAGQMNYSPKKCNDSSAPAPTGAPRSVTYNPFYVETGDIQ